jgi:hypothetical protein
VISPEAYDRFREAWRDSIPAEFRFEGWHRLDMRGEGITNFQANEDARQERSKANRAADNERHRRAKQEMKKAARDHREQAHPCAVCGKSFSSPRRAICCSPECRKTRVRQRHQQIVTA